MAPSKRTATSSKRAQAAMKQSLLSFKSRKRGAAASPQTKAKIKAKSSAKVTSVSESEGEESESAVEASLFQEENNRKTLDRRDKANAYKNYRKEVKKLMGWILPIHAEGQDEIDHMLRVFDNTYDYGPCVGMTRLERWERAKALGLNPPNEVRDILLTEEGSKDPELVHPVFKDEVL